MHFDILVEDSSGKILLENLVPKIIGVNDTCRIKAFHGIGSIPKGLKDSKDVKHKQLLNALPRLLRAYGQTYARYGKDYKAALVVICDLDDRCLKVFRRQLFSLLNNCHPAPEARFCVAVEEGEAWILGDMQAIKMAFPHAKQNVLNMYHNDDICGTWELLADAVCPDGRKKLSAKGWYAVGAEKCRWAVAVSKYMDIERNQSPSFNYLVQKLHELVKWGDANA